MERAQRRDALHTEKFYFRKDVLPLGRTVPASSVSSSSSGSSSPVGYSSNGQVYKEKKLLNCFPSLARPENIVDSPVDQEYEEMTVDEIINGKVGGGSF